MDEKFIKKFREGETKTKYFGAVGRRKEAIAQVRMILGKGLIVVNSKEIGDYFDSGFAKNLILAPLKQTANEKKFDISVIVKGGGINSQAEAIRLGIARTLVKIDESLRVTLKKQGFLTRDSREKERKKYGLKKARRAPQWQKR